MKRNKIRTTSERYTFFEQHVLEYFDNDEQRIFEQIAYMQYSYNGSVFERARHSSHEIVMGGCLLVSYYDMDELRKEMPGCIDGRLNVYNAWEKYVLYCTGALTRIARRFKVEPGNVHEILKSVMYEKFLDHHESDLYVKKTPVSTFVINSMNNQTLVSTFTDQTDGSTWYDLPFCYNPNL